jgi:hypothetical protein
MRRPWLSIIVAVLTSAAAAGQPPNPDERQPVDKEREPTAQASAVEGMLVSLTGNNLAVRVGAPGNKSAEEVTFTLTRDVKVVQNSRPLAPSALRPGMRVRVTTTGAENAASRVEILTKGPDQ